MASRAFATAADGVSSSAGPGKTTKQVYRDCLRLIQHMAGDVRSHMFDLPYLSDRLNCSPYLPEPESPSSETDCEEPIQTKYARNK